MSAPSRRFGALRSIRRLEPFTRRRSLASRCHERTASGSRSCHWPRRPRGRASRRPRSRLGVLSKGGAHFGTSRAHSHPRAAQRASRPRRSAGAAAAGPRTTTRLVRVFFMAARSLAATRVNGSRRRMPRREPKRREGADDTSAPPRALAETEHPRFESFTRWRLAKNSARRTQELSV